MISYEQFKEQFDIDSPDDFLMRISAYESYIKRLLEEYANIWTYCGGCCKPVRRTDITIIHIPEKKQYQISCKHCGTPWKFISEENKSKDTGALNG